MTAMNRTLLPVNYPATDVVWLVLTHNLSAPTRVSHCARILGYKFDTCAKHLHRLVDAGAAEWVEVDGYAHRFFHLTHPHPDA